MIFEALVFMGMLALILGIIISYASRKFAVQESALVKEISDVLPKFNCGACGYAGCEAYAIAVSKGEAACNLCKPGKQEIIDKIKQLLEKNNSSEKNPRQQSDSKDLP
jgi:Na+-translocating ferredoxin:NAD+ oxidoreductase subunit B